MPPRDSRLYTITELADELAVTPRAIRFYESKGLLAPQRAGANRVYDYRDRARLLIILRGKRMGFSLAGVKQYLDLYDADPTHRGQLFHLLAGARQRIAELEEQRRDLDLTLGELHDVERQVLDAMAKAGVEPPPFDPDALPCGATRTPRTDDLDELTGGAADAADPADLERPSRRRSTGSAATEPSAVDPNARVRRSNSRSTARASSRTNSNSATPPADPLRGGTDPS